jgi:hypothetical protein
MTDLSKAYTIPENPLPEDTVCFKVIVPSDTLYIGAFWRAYEFFTSWLAWERDESHTALQVAELWQTCFDEARAMYDAGERCECEMDVRQKPGEPCILQKYIDGAWVDFADLTLCRDATTVTPVYTEPTPERSAEGQEADDILWWFKVLIESTITDVDGEIDPPIIIADHTAEAGGQTGVQLGAGITELVNALTGHTEQQRHDERDAFDWEGLREAVLCSSMAFSIQSDFPGWLNAFSEALEDWLNASSSWLANSLDLIASTLGGGGANGMGQAGWAAGGGGSGFGFTTDPVCPEDYDFTYMGANYRRVGPFSITCVRPPGAGEDGWGYVENAIPAGWMVVAGHTVAHMTPDAGGWAAFWWLPQEDMPPGTRQIPGSFGPWQGYTDRIFGVRDVNECGDGIFAAAGLTEPETSTIGVQSSQLGGPSPAWVGHALGGDAGYQQIATYKDYIILKEVI